MFDPIYQVILLENSNEWNLSPAKEGSSKKKEKWERKRKRKKEKGLKSKRGETSYEEAPSFKRRKEKKDDGIYKLLGEILSKERKEITFSYSGKSDVWPQPHPHIICICTTFYSLTFPCLTPIHYTILHQQWLFATQTL
jgi:hypothetical protein